MKLGKKYSDLFREVKKKPGPMPATRKDSVENEAALSLVSRNNNLKTFFLQPSSHPLIDTFETTLLLFSSQPTLRLIRNLPSEPHFLHQGKHFLA